MTAPINEPGPKPNSPKFLEARNRMPEDLRPVCRAEIPAPPSKPLAGFYQGPVVDATGSACA